jgi:hypothetical protein
VLAAQGDLAGAATALRASLMGLRKPEANLQDLGELSKSARELAAALRAQGDEAGALEAEASVL